MALVTAIPRMLPFLIDIEKYLPRFALTGLQFVPVAALSALILPGIFYVGDTPLVGIAAGSTAVALSLMPRNNLLVTMLLAFLVCLGVEAVSV